MTHLPPLQIWKKLFNGYFLGKLTFGPPPLSPIWKISRLYWFLVAEQLYTQPCVCVCLMSPVLCVKKSTKPLPDILRHIGLSKVCETSSWDLNRGTHWLRILVWAECVRCPAAMQCSFVCPQICMYLRNSSSIFVLVFTCRTVFILISKCFSLSRPRYYMG
jgi:hypothetical protein